MFSTNGMNFPAWNKFSAGITGSAHLELLAAMPQTPGMQPESSFLLVGLTFSLRMQLAGFRNGNSLESSVPMPDASACPNIGQYSLIVSAA